jgi:perilipin-4
MSSSKRNMTRSRHEHDRQDQPPTRPDDNNEQPPYTHRARARGMSDAPIRTDFDSHSHHQQHQHNHHHVTSHTHPSGGTDGHASVPRRVMVVVEAPDTHQEQALLSPQTPVHGGASNEVGGRATRDRGDSVVRGRSVSNATDPKEGSLHSHSHSPYHGSTREGSMTPTSPQALSSAEGVPAQAPDALRTPSEESKASESLPKLRTSHSYDTAVPQEQRSEPKRRPILRRLSQASSSPSLSSPADSSKLVKMGFGRRSRPSDASVPPASPSDTSPGPAPPAKDTHFLSPSNIPSPSSGVFPSFHSLPWKTTAASSHSGRSLARQQSDMALNTSSATKISPNAVPKTSREYRRRSVGDTAGASRPQTSGSTTSGESSNPSMEPPKDVNNVNSSSSAAPLLSLVIPPPTLTDQHEFYDLSQDIFISPPRSDRRGRDPRHGNNDASPVVPNSSSSSLTRTPAGDAAAPADKGKKIPWRDRLLAVATSNAIGSSSSSAASSSLSLSSSSSADHHHSGLGGGGGGSRSARSRIHLWSQSAASAKPVSPVDSPADKDKKTRARLLHPDSLS